MKKTVSVRVEKNLDYYRSAPFHPQMIYPEFQDILTEAADGNEVYTAVRETLHGLGLDDDHWNTSQWNPFREIIHPGNLVVVKPNFVIHHNNRNTDIDAVVTHGSILRPLVDYALLALRGSGSVIIGDAPQANADFHKVVERNGVRALVDWYQAKGAPVKLCDFRKNWYPHGFWKGTRVNLPGDPNGYCHVNLGKQSFLQDLPHKERLYGADFDRSFVVEKQSGGHEYLYSGSVLQADVVLSVPKLKTHRKAGITINSKNMVGANGDKNYLAHYRVGTPAEGGDEIPDDLSGISRKFYAVSRYGWDHFLVKNTMASRLAYMALFGPLEGIRRIRKKLTGRDYMMGHGDWHGNDTVWRMCLDLNQILQYVDKDGNFCPAPQRRIISFVDGIIAGEGDGPLRPTPRRLGYLAAGVDASFPVDYVCAWMMGFDPSKLKVLEQARTSRKLSFCPPPVDDVACVMDGESIDYTAVNLHVEPQKYWKGYIER